MFVKNYMVTFEVFCICFKTFCFHSFCIFFVIIFTMDKNDKMNLPQKYMSLIYYNNSLQLVTLFFTFLATISSSANCRAKCLNKGICHSNTVCYCTDDFIGAQCEIPVRKFWVFVKLFFFFVKIKFLSLFNFNWFAKHCMISIGSI